MTKRLQASRCSNNNGRRVAFKSDQWQHLVWGEIADFSNVGVAITKQLSAIFLSIAGSFEKTFATISRPPA